jgi:hypothetical protein
MTDRENAVNDKKKPFEFTISIDEAKEYGIPAKILLKMILANMSRRYTFLYPSIKNLAEWTGLKVRTVENELYRLVADGWLVKAVDEAGRKGYTKGLHQISAKIHQISADLHSTSADLHQVSADLHQSDSAKYTNLVQKIHQPDETHYISNNKLNLTKKEQEEEGSSTPVAFGSSCVSEFSSSVSVSDELQELITNPPFAPRVAETDFGNPSETPKSSPPQAITLHGVTYTISKPVNASGSSNGTTGHSDTRADVVQGNGGTEMEPTQGREVVVTKPKSNKPKKAKSYTEYAEQDFFWPDHWTGRGRQALQTWVEYKRDTGKAVLLQSYQQAIKNFIGDESGFVLAVDHSIANAYQGLIKPTGNQLREAQKQQQHTEANSTDWHDQLAELLAMKD